MVSLVSGGGAGDPEPQPASPPWGPSDAHPTGQSRPSRQAPHPHGALAAAPHSPAPPSAPRHTGPSSRRSLGGLTPGLQARSVWRGRQGSPRPCLGGLGPFCLSFLQLRPWRLGLSPSPHCPPQRRGSARTPHVCVHDRFPGSVSAWHAVGVLALTHMFLPLPPRPAWGWAHTGRLTESSQRAAWSAPRSAPQVVRSDACL